MLIRTSWMLGWGESGEMNSDRFYIDDDRLSTLTFSLQYQLEDGNIICSVTLPVLPANEAEEAWLTGLFQGVLSTRGFSARIMILGRRVIALPRIA